MDIATNINKDYFKDISVVELPSSETQIANRPLKVIPYTKPISLRYKTWKYDSGGFEKPEYNLYEISAAKEVDGIIKQTIEKKSSLILKEGYSLSGYNNETLKYIHLRLKQLELSQKKPWDILLDEIADDFVSYNNVFLFKARSNDASGGSKREIRVTRKKDVHPVAAYFRLPAETIRFQTDEYGNVLKYRQVMPDGRSRDFKPEDIIHIYYKRRAGFHIACPSIWPALDDIKILRKIEENVEFLTQQYVFPLYILTIGNDAMPSKVFKDNTTEVDLWENKIKNLSVEGGIVADHRVNMKVIGFDKIIPIEKYLEYFKQRAYISLGISSVDLGEAATSNRATSDTISKALLDSIRSYQRTLKSFIEYEIINELLLERYDPSSLLDENMVFFNFTEISMDAQIKFENHTAMMYTMNVITEEEARQRFKLKPLDDTEREKMYYKLTGKEIVENAAMASAKSKQQPTNQHGKALGPEQRKSSLENNIRTFLMNLDSYNPDLLKIRLTNHLFSLDTTSYSQLICTENIDAIDTIIDNIDADNLSSIPTIDLVSNLIATTLIQE